MNRYRWMAVTFPYGPAAQFEALVINLLMAGVRVTCFDLPGRGVLVVSWLKEWKPQAWGAN